MVFPSAILWVKTPMSMPNESEKEWAHTAISHSILINKCKQWMDNNAGTVDRVFLSIGLLQHGIFVCICVYGNVLSLSTGLSWVCVPLAPSMPLPSRQTLYLITRMKVRVKEKYYGIPFLSLSLFSQGRIHTFRHTHKHTQGQSSERTHISHMLQHSTSA